jgi:hypothetical protein
MPAKNDFAGLGFRRGKTSRQDSIAAAFAECSAVRPHELLHLVKQALGNIRLMLSGPDSHGNILRGVVEEVVQPGGQDGFEFHVIVRADLVKIVRVTAPAEAFLPMQ